MRKVSRQNYWENQLKNHWSVMPFVTELENIALIYNIETF